MNNHIGSSFDDFLREEGIWSETDAIVRVRILVFFLATSPRDSGPPV